jgi:hypothetical protein
MEFIENIFAFFDSHVSAVTILSLIGGGVWAMINYNEQRRDKRFKTYHKLIDWLVNEQAQPDRVIKLDRQIAVVYELRNFPKYFDVSKRILIGLSNSWKNGDKRILTEIELSVAYMNKSWVKRFFSNHFLR